MLELDPNLQLIIVGLITMLVTEGLKVVSGWMGLDLSGAGAAVTAGVVALILTFLGALLGLVPPEYHEIAKAVMSLLVVLLSAFGVHSRFKKLEPARG